MKIDRADRYFSYFVRERDDWVCQKCKRKYERKSQGLHCSHFFGRRAESTRFVPMNADSHCMGCHTYLGSNPLYFAEWKENQLGETVMQELRDLHNTHKKKDRKTEAAYWKMRLLQMCEKKGIDFNIYK